MEPQTWQDVLDMATTVQESDPEAVPFMLYAGTGTGEGSTCRASTSCSTARSSAATRCRFGVGQRVVESQGFIDSLEFVDTVYSEGYALPADQALDPNVWQSVFGELFPEGRLGATIEGSYTPSFWVEGGSFEWPEYAEEMGATAFPTQNGDGDG